MGMVKIEIVRPKDERAKRRWDMSLALEPSDVSRGVCCWNTKNVFMVAPCMGSAKDLPGAKTTFLTPLGEFQTAEEPWSLAARVHQADVDGESREICQACGNLTPKQHIIQNAGVCLICDAAKKAEAAS